MATTIAPTFTAGGLASGLDTASIITGLTKVEQLPLDQLKSDEASVKSNISVLGGFITSLNALQAATDNLGQSGLIASSVQSTTTSFSATAQAGAALGSYGIQVESVATAAKARSQAFGSLDAQLAGGTLHLSVNGKNTDVTIADGTGITDVAAAINKSGAGVNANVVFDGTHAYLNFTNQATGFTGSDASSALQISFSPATDSNGNAIASQYTALSATGLQPPATNAVFKLDGLEITRQSNTVSDAIQGVTLTLTKGAQAAAETLTVGRDSSSVQSRLQQFVDAYNAVATQLSSTLNPSDPSQAPGTLASDAGLRQLQSRMQALTSTSVFSTGGVRSLADLGISTQKDGTLTINAATLQAAVARDPAGVNAIFNTANTGMTAVVAKMVHEQANPVDGLLLAEQQGMQDQVKTMDAHVAQMQTHIDAFTAQLQAQFSAMEDIISGLKSTANYLTALSNASSGSSK